MIEIASSTVANPPRAIAPFRRAVKRLSRFEQGGTGRWVDGFTAISHFRFELGSSLVRKIGRGRRIYKGTHIFSAQVNNNQNVFVVLVTTHPQVFKAD
jgi:hypothetical protein